MTFGSVYEILTPLTTVRKQKFWDWFDGDDLKSIWTKTDLYGGTGIFAMSDNTDEGFSVKTDTGSGDQSELDFNNIRHYSHTASVCISVVRRVSATAVITGFVGQIVGDDLEVASYNDSTVGSSFKRLYTADASTGSDADSSVAPDTAWTTAKIVMGSSDIRLWINGVLEVTKTTNRPTVKQQPYFSVFTQSGGGTIEGRIRYYEAYNT
jgi:hypothetical protein